MADPIAIVVKRSYEQSSEQVFDAWLDPERARRFLFATKTGTVVHADIDPRVGGRFMIVDRRGDQDAQHFGEYLELQRPRRLAFQFSVEAPGTDATRVVVEIEPGNGGCELTLTHEIPGELASVADRTRAGWATILEQLASALA